DADDVRVSRDEREPSRLPRRLHREQLVEQRRRTRGQPVGDERPLARIGLRRPHPVAAPERLEERHAVGSLLAVTRLTPQQHRSGHSRRGSAGTDRRVPLHYWASRAGSHHAARTLRTHTRMLRPSTSPGLPTTSVRFSPAWTSWTWRLLLLLAAALYVAGPLAAVATTPTVPGWLVAALGG